MQPRSAPGHVATRFAERRCVGRVRRKPLSLFRRSGPYALWLITLAACPAAADAQQVPRAEFGIELENDKKLLEWHELGRNGNDLGRTASSRAWLSIRVAERWRVTAHVHTELFSEVLTDDQGRPLRLTFREERQDDRLIHFLEYNLMRVGARHDVSPDISFTAWAGLMRLNRRRVTEGATGMQRRLHRIVQRWRPEFRQYSYIPDGGGIRSAALIEFEARFARPILTGRVARLVPEVIGNSRLVTLPEAIYFGGAVGLRLELGPPAPSGRRWFAIGVQEIVRVFPDSAVAMLDAHFYASFEGRYVGLRVGWDIYHGSPHRSLFSYNAINRTMLVGVSLKLP